jgi:hypothetical protein avisC_03608
MFLGGCLSWLDRGRGDRDNRFAEFTEYTTTEAVVKTDLAAVEKRMPGIKVTEAHWVGEQKETGRYDLPAPEPRYWFHLVATLSSDSVDALVKASTGTVDVLPGIQPDLRKYVPTQGAFVSVPQGKADEILDVKHVAQGDEKEWEGDVFNVEQLVVSSASNVMILIGRGIMR